MSGWKTHAQPAGRENFIVDMRYTNFEPIGDGSYGFVCAADDQVTGKRVAVKKVKDIFRDLTDAKRILRELKLLRHFRPHENVVTIIDIMVYPQNTLDFRDIYIVTSLMESDLQKVIASTQPLTDQHFHYFLYQLLRGLKYIHSANVLHRDLKPSNLVLNANCDLAICDFGLARGIEQEGGETLTEYVQTRWYRAPELLSYASTYDTAVDMWSVGCIFAELLARRPFFQGKNPMHQLQTIIDVLGCPPDEDLSFIQDKAVRTVILRAKQAASTRGCSSVRPLSYYFPPGTSPLALDLLARMLVFNPRKRIGVEEALEHPYLRDLHAQMLGKEPACPRLFDFEFEKDDGSDASGFLRRRQRVIPREELQALMLEEVSEYRPGARGNAILMQARQIAAERHRKQHTRHGSAPAGWLSRSSSIDGSFFHTGSSEVTNDFDPDVMDAQDMDVFCQSAQAALPDMGPMGAIGAGMVTPTPGVHGYPGAVPYSNTVPPRGGALSQPHPSQHECWDGAMTGGPSSTLRSPFQAFQSSAARGRAANASPAVAAAIATATAAASLSDLCQNGPSDHNHGRGFDNHVRGEAWSAGMMGFPNSMETRNGDVRFHRGSSNRQGGFRGRNHMS